MRSQTYEVSAKCTVNWRLLPKPLISGRSRIVCVCCAMLSWHGHAMASTQAKWVVRNQFRSCCEMRSPRETKGKSSYVPELPTKEDPKRYFRTAFSRAHLMRKDEGVVGRWWEQMREVQGRPEREREGAREE